MDVVGSLVGRTPTRGVVKGLSIAIGMGLCALLRNARAVGSIVPIRRLVYIAQVHLDLAVRMQSVKI